MKPSGRAVSRPVGIAAALLLGMGIWGCGGNPSASEARASTPASAMDAVAEALYGRAPDGDSLDARIREIAHSQGLRGFPHLQHPNWTPEQKHLVALRAQLGELLFSDHALSGLKQTSCSTCHSGYFHFADGRRISSGLYCTQAADGSQAFCSPAPPVEDGNVVGPFRTAGSNDFRSAPTVINTGLFPSLMMNGRFFFEDPKFVDQHITDVNELDPSYGFQIQQPEGVLHTRSLGASQPFKPTPDKVEMAGDWPDVGQPFRKPALAHDLAVFQGLAQRISNSSAYHQLFEAAYPVGESVYPNYDVHIGPGDAVPFHAIADAIGYFEEIDLEMTNAPWDHFLTGEDDAISTQAKRGALIFFTRGHCSACHSGDLFDDFKNHNIGVVQIGTGEKDSDDADPKYRDIHTYDFGLEEITHNRADRFKFRTPPLRGVTLTPPYMHDGAYASLADAILEHTSPRKYYAEYDVSRIVEQDVASYGKKPLAPIFDPKNPVEVGPGTEYAAHLSHQDVADLIAFLRTLTDPRMLNTEIYAPKALPSGLPADVPGPARYPTFQSGPIDGAGHYGRHRRRRHHHHPHLHGLD